MKQKVVTKAIIKQDDKILLVRRKGGRPTITGLYELPGGRVHIGQQPEDALKHGLRIHLNVAPETCQLRDVMTFIDPDDRELQYMFIVFGASLEPFDKTIRLSDDHDKYVWKSLQEIQREHLTKSTQQVLGIQAIPFGTGHDPEVDNVDDKKATLKKAIIYSDGGSRGNPGPSASGFVILNEKNNVVVEGGAFLGITTNNVAEYQAVYLGLEKAQEIGVCEVDFRMDSQLVANQMNGIYKVKHKDLIPINNRIRELAYQFDKVTFSHVMREYNKLADGMVNKILDEHER